MRKKDLFLCHSSSDKDQYVRPFSKILDNYIIDYWLDEAEIKWGDTISQKVEEGVSVSTLVVVFMSDSIVNSDWVNDELELARKEEERMGQTKILPLILPGSNLDIKKIPFLRDRHTIHWNEVNGIEAIVSQICRSLNREFKKNWVYFHPSEYSGKVWIRILPEKSSAEQPMEVVIKWGQWVLKRTFHLNSSKPLCLVHHKGNDKLSIPLQVSLSSACYVDFGHGDIGVDSEVTIDEGWVKSRNVNLAIPWGKIIKWRRR